MEASKRRNLTWALTLCGTLLAVAAVQAGESVIQADQYVFSPEQSTIVQTGGFAGVHWTYSVKGQFCLIVDPDAGTARFEQVDANAVDVIEPARTLDPNAVFNLTGLTGVIANDAIEFTGQTADGSTVGLTLAVEGDTVRLTGQTTPPPNSADFFVFAIDAVATRKYAGGTGDPNTPYQIATAEQMNAIGTHPEDWDKHFQLTADIDLSAFDGKDARPAFNIIAPDVDAEEWDVQGIPFAGVFDGGGHTIAHFSWSGSDKDCVGLFGYLSGSNAEVKNLGLVDPNLTVAGGSNIGALIGHMGQGIIRNCFVEGGAVCGGSNLGGLVGDVQAKSEFKACYATAKVSGGSYAGGLIGKSRYAVITHCHTDNQVDGNWYVGGLVGDNSSSIEDSYSTSDVSGDRYVGGLVGQNQIEYPGRRSTGETVWHTGIISDCYATGHVSGDEGVGGLVGGMYEGTLTRSYATASVSGTYRVGGLVGINNSEVTSCCSASDVTGADTTGGLVGANWRRIANCYASGTVIGIECTGGLAGYNRSSLRNCYATGFVSGELETGGLVGAGQSRVISCYWDIETSGQTTSAQGTGGTTAQMQLVNTYGGWGGCGDEGIWTLDEGNNYPRLSWEERPGEAIGPASLSDHLAGAGTEDDPYLIYTPEELNAVGLFPCEWGRHFRLMADIDLSTGAGDGFNMIGDYDTPFTGVFDGNGYIISHFSYYTPSRPDIGLFGWIEDPNALIIGVGMVDPNVDAGTGWCVGSLVGWLRAGTVSHCYIRGGHVRGGSNVGGLVGQNEGTIKNCDATGEVVGTDSVGGLAGSNIGTLTECRAACEVVGADLVGVLVGCNGNELDRKDGIITLSSANGTAVGETCVGGLAGFSIGTVANCYAHGTATGNERVGGLVGYRQKGTITNCYSTTAIVGDTRTGGLVGLNTGGIIGAFASFWDIETSGQKTSPVGKGLTTTQMQTAATYLDAGWDFVGETANGTEDLWWIDEGQDYPRLWWEAEELIIDD